MTYDARELRAATLPFDHHRLAVACEKADTLNDPARTAARYEAVREAGRMGLTAREIRAVTGYCRRTISNIWQGS